MKKKYDWDLLQRDYNNGLTLRKLREKYGIAMATLVKAQKNGDIIFRSKSQAVALSAIKNPRKHTEETKQKISEIRKNYLAKHPEKVPYRLNHHRKGPSYPELYFQKLFEKEQIDLEPEIPYAIYQLDFANIQKKIDIEIDGDQHYLDKKIIESDKRRNAVLEKDGWLTFRIKWSDYQKLAHEEKQKVIEAIRKLLE